MCPACLSVAAAYVAGAGSIGGVATLIFKRFGSQTDDRTSEARNKESARKAVPEDRSKR